MPGIATIAKLLLKARPTPAQLADRFAVPVPQGLELYLDAADIEDRDDMRKLAKQLVDLRPNPEFTYVVEGPLRSLDGEFFDLSVNSPANREVLRRISAMAEMIEAEAVLVHAITPMVLDTRLSQTLRLEKLEASLPLVEHYVQTAEECGVMPLLENIPPVARQRQSAFMVTPVGMSAGDLVFFAEAFPGLGATVDLSHAQLFLNGRQMDPATVQPELAPLVSYLSTFEDGRSMEQYLDRVGKYLVEVHVSNARGLLEEGLAYGDGDLDIDSLVPRIGRTARYMVTETIEPDPDRGARMREAQQRLQAALSAIPDDDAGPASQEDPV